MGDDRREAHDQGPTGDGRRSHEADRGGEREEELPSRPQPELQPTLRVGEPRHQHQPADVGGTDDQRAPPRDLTDAGPGSGEHHDQPQRQQRDAGHQPPRGVELDSVEDLQLVDAHRPEQQRNP
jgi:hypothetical protein